MVLITAGSPTDVNYFSGVFVNHTNTPNSLEGLTDEELKQALGLFQGSGGVNASTHGTSK